MLVYTKRQGCLGNVGIMGFVFTSFQGDNYGTSSGNDEGNCMYNWTGGEVSQYKYCRYGWGQSTDTELYETIGGDEGKGIPKSVK